MATGRHLGFSNYVSVNGQRVAEVPGASSCQNSSKLPHLQRYFEFLILQDGGRPHFGFVFRVYRPLTKHIWWCVLMCKNNLAAIHAVVLIM